MGLDYCAQLVMCDLPHLHCKIYFMNYQLMVDCINSFVQAQGFTSRIDQYQGIQELPITLV